MTGRLGLFSLVDLLQLLAGAGRTGRLAVRHPRGDARIYFDSGDVVHAEFDDLVGEEAVFALFLDEQGDFAFKSGLPAPRVSVDIGTQNLVLEAVRRLDEARRDAGEQVIPLESDVVPERVAADGAAGGPQLGPPELALLEHVDGRRSLARVGELAGLPFDEAARIGARLLAAGVLVVRKRRPRTARLVVRPADRTLPSGTVAIDEDIVEAWTRAMGRVPREVLCRRQDGRVERLRVVAQPDAGPYLTIGREALMRTGLVADQALLVRPSEEDA